MRTPMPSPRGTNHAGLYLNGRNPAGALDEALSPDRIQEIVTLLKGLGKEDIAAIRAAFVEAGADPMAAMDDPAPFPGRPQTGGGQDPLKRAMDKLPHILRAKVYDALIDARAAHRVDFAKRFPGAARIGIDYHRCD